MGKVGRYVDDNDIVLLFTFFQELLKGLRLAVRVVHSSGGRGGGSHFNFFVLSASLSPAVYLYFTFTLSPLEKVMMVNRGMSKNRL